MALVARIVSIVVTLFVCQRRFTIKPRSLNFRLSQNRDATAASRFFLLESVMGAVVIAVVFVAGLFGAPTMFGHGHAHAAPQAQQQEVVASAQVQAPGAGADAAGERP
jgi:Na+/H+ antiporter NhaD/arsenite permease-like protein